MPRKEQQGDQQPQIEHQKNQELLNFDDPRGAVLRLVDQPTRLAALIEEIQSFRIRAGIEGNQEQTTTKVISFLDQCLRIVQEVDIWQPPEDQECRSLSPEQSRLLLQHIDQGTAGSLSKKRRGTTTKPVQRRIENLSQQILHGFLDLQFPTPKQPASPNLLEKPGARNWRGSLQVLAEILDGLLLDVTDLDLVRKYFRLITGQYTSALKQRELAWHSMILGLRAARAEDEEIFRIATDVVSSIKSTGDAIGETNRISRNEHELSKVVRRFQLLVAQYIAIKDHPAHLRGPYDPRTVKGMQHFSKHVVPLSAQQNSAYRIVNTNTTSSEELQAAFEIASDKSAFQRFKDLEEALETLISPHKNTATMPHSSRRSAKMVQFPQNILLNLSPRRKMLGQLEDESQTITEMRKLFREGIDSDESLGPTIVFDFHIKDVAGTAAIAKSEFESEYPTEREKINKLEAIITEGGLGEDWEDRKEVGENLLGQRYIAPGRAVFMFTRQRYSTMSPLMQLVRIQVPPSMREGGLNRIKELHQRKLDAMSLGQGLTAEGDLYPLGAHEQVGSFLREGSVKYGDSGGFTVQLAIQPNQQYLPDLQHPTILGEISMSGLAVSLRLLGDANKLPIDLRTVFEKVMIELFISSCCVPIEEGEQQAAQLIEESEKKEAGHDIRPRLVHVGGMKRNPEGGGLIPKQFTDRAQQNMVDFVVKILGIAEQDVSHFMQKTFGGADLMRITEKHWQQHEDCDRYLTWNVGHIVEGKVSYPVTRKAPDTLI